MNDWNIDLLTENTVWTEEKIWSADGQLISKEEMQENTEYVIF